MSYTSNDLATGRTGTPELSESDRHRLLANGQRRAAIEILADRQAPVDLTDLAAAVSVHTGDDAPSTATDDDVRTMLHHCHLPKLEAAGVVDYDAAANTVEAGPFLPDLLG